MLLRLVASAVVLSTSLVPLTAQTGDESRLVVGVSIGYIGGADLWSVSNQPITAVGAVPDIFALKRRLRSNITVNSQVTYFPSPNFGYTGELGYTGLGTEESCRLVVSNGDFRNQAACAAINGSDRSAAAVNLLGGITFRLASRSEIQPYAKILAGISLVPRNTVELSSVFGEFEDTLLPIYLSDGTGDIKPTGALAIGFATSPNGGSQFRVELRGTWVRLSSVDGPTLQEGLIPPNSSRFVLVPSLTVGFDIVLEKRRGRRY
ncbi:MAG: hypothetical protein SFU57_02900 [Gemmatimonadales bacterium]|nr:hypothetical protein [Gemmatimonadales bacterium]